MLFRSERGLTEAERRLAAARDTCRDAMAAGGASDELTRHRNWILGVTRDRDRCSEVLATRTARVEDALATERQAYQQVRIIERLRDRLKRRHDAEDRRREAAEMDQRAVLQFARRVSGGCEP